MITLQTMSSPGPSHNIHRHACWITGASSGIGEAIALQLAAKKHPLVLSGRNKQALEVCAEQCRKLGSPLLHILPFDLGMEQNYDEMCTKLWSEFGPVHTLYHCGGISQRSLVREGDPAIDRRIMEVNFFGAALLTKAILPHMIQHGSGHFTVVSSLTGKFGFPYRSAYAASKHALHGFFESLYLEEWKHGIGITLACPGRVKTNISLNALSTGGKTHGTMDPGQEKGISAESCARQIIQATEKGKKEVNIGGADRLMVFFKRFCPPLFFAIAKRISAK